MPRNLAPKGKVKNLRSKIEAFAKTHGLVIDKRQTRKLTWMANHKGRCYCDWEHRSCPCNNVMQDLKRFNGRCLCRLLWTKEALEKHMSKPRKRKKKKRTAEEKAADREKQKENERLFKKIFKK